MTEPPIPPTPPQADGGDQGSTRGTDHDTTVDRAPAGSLETHADTDMAGTAPSGELEDQ